MGCITGVAGGVVRDILAMREIPMVLRKEVYVTACLLSGSIYVVLLSLGWVMLPSMFCQACSFAVRTSAFMQFRCIFSLKTRGVSSALQRKSNYKWPVSDDGPFIWWSYADRTADPLHAMQALSQLSYNPEIAHLPK